LKYLLDTCTISELIKSSPNENVVNWISTQNGADLHISAITVGEIRKGIELARPTAYEFAIKLETWLNSLIGNYRTRIMPFDEKAAQVWGELMARHPQIALEDSQIAAIAMTNEMTVITRNEKDFSPLGVAFFNPF